MATQQAPAAPNEVIIRPQAGPQEQFLASPADIVIYGGAAFGGKTYALLLEQLRNVGNPKFHGIIFRRNTTHIRSPGGLLDTSQQIYPKFGGRLRDQALEWVFPSGATIQFAHLEHEATKTEYQGSQIPLIGWDELCHFSGETWWYLYSRNRDGAGSGIRPYMRATCNPDPDSFVRSLIDWWIGKDGYAIPERSGVIRWFVRCDDVMVWADTREELEGKFTTPDGRPIDPTSLTFILSTVFDNKIGLSADPGYVARLQAMPLVDRERLLGDSDRGGNWNIRAGAELIPWEWFEPHFERNEPEPHWRRYLWVDPAFSTRNTADDAAIAYMWCDEDGKHYVRSCESGRWGIEKLCVKIIDLARVVDPEVIGIEQLQFLEPYLKIVMRQQNKFYTLVELKALPGDGQNGDDKEPKGIIRATAPWYQNGRVVHHVSLKGSLLEHQLNKPTTAHDDCANVVAYGIRMGKAAGKPKDDRPKLPFAYLPLEEQERISLKALTSGKRRG